MTAAWLALAIVIAGAVALVVGSLSGHLTAGAGAPELAGVVAMVALAVWIGPGVIRRYHGRGSTALAHAAIWLILVLAVALLYRFRGVLMPG
jgi:hypothetical protein